MIAIFRRWRARASRSIRSYEALVVADIAAGADLFRPLYDETNGGDGYIEAEVSPTLANNTPGTIADAAACSRPLAVQM